MPVKTITAGWWQKGIWRLNAKGQPAQETGANDYESCWQNSDTDLKTQDVWHEVRRKTNLQDTTNKMTA